MKKEESAESKKKLTKKEVAKIVKSSSRKHKLPPNKVVTPKKAYKRDRKVEEDE